MTEDEIRAALTSEIAAGLRVRMPVETIADTLLPTVRRIVAAELRAAAAYLTDFRLPSDQLRDRADAWDQR